MDSLSTFLQIIEWLVVGWIALAVLVAVGLAIFLMGAGRRERDLPERERDIRTWVLGDEAKSEVPPVHKRRRKRRNPAA